jgi:hypothetical protein
MLAVLAMAAAAMAEVKADPPAPFEHTAVIAHVVMGAPGEVQGCTVETIGKGAADISPKCDSLADPRFLGAVLGEALDDAKAIDVRLLGEAVGSGPALPVVAQAFDMKRRLALVDVEIGRDGHVRRCTPSETDSVAGTQFNLCDGMTGKTQDFVADPAATEIRHMKISFEVGVINR